MANRLLLTAFLNSLVILGISQESTIELQLQNYAKDYLLIAHYGGEQLLVDDTLKVAEPGVYKMDASQLESGPYIIVSLEEKKFFDYIKNANDQAVTIVSDWNSLPERKITGSPENQGFLDYVAVLNQYNAKVQENNKLIDQQGEDSEMADKANDQLEAELQKVTDAKVAMLTEFEGTYISTIIKSQDNLIYPDHSDVEEDQLRFNYSYRLDHFFDRISHDSRFFRSRYFKNMVRKYVDEYTVQHPDSMFQSMKTVLDMVEPEVDVFQHYLVSWINKYAQSSKMNEEKVWVNLTHEYISTNRADDFVPAEAKAQMIGRADVQALCFNGLKAQDLTMSTLDLDSTLALDLKANNKKFYVLGEPKSLYEREDKVTVVFFWKASCDHCKEAFPVLVELEKKYREQGLGVYAINVGSYKKYQEAAQFIVDNNGEDLDHMVDPEYKSQYAKKFAVRNTPGIFILDEKKKIVYNRMGASQLEDFVLRVMRDKGMIPANSGD